ELEGPIPILKISNTLIMMRPLLQSEGRSGGAAAGAPRGFLKTHKKKNKIEKTQKQKKKKNI
ncbi:hypothetical protein ACVGWN_00015, partial [Enterobacter hormaechei]